MKEGESIRRIFDATKKRKRMEWKAWLCRGGRVSLLLDGEEPGEN